MIDLSVTRKKRRTRKKNKFRYVSGFPEMSILQKKMVFVALNQNAQSSGPEKTQPEDVKKNQKISKTEMS